MISNLISIPFKKLNKYHKINATLLPSDTTYLAMMTCDPTQAGVSQNIFTNQFGCDSVVITTISIANDFTCFMDFETAYAIAFDDPCYCNNPLNNFVNDVYLLEDTLIATGPEGQEIRFVAQGSSDFLDMNGNLIADQTAFVEGPPGVYKLQFYRPSEVVPIIMVSFNGDTPLMVPESAVTLCFCQYPIPTLSQWGIILLTLGLLIIGIIIMRSGQFIPRYEP